MKNILPTVALLIATLQLSFAGGNTSVVRLDKVTSIKIEAKKIIIVGSGMVQKRVMSDAEHGDSTALGQPTQWLHAKVTDCEFEIVPYFTRSETLRVSGPDSEKIALEMKAKSKEWWAATLARAKEFEIGDAISIGYQGEKMTLTNFYVTKIVGAGTIQPREVEKKLALSNFIFKAQTPPIDLHFIRRKKMDLRAVLSQVPSDVSWTPFREDFCPRQDPDSRWRELPRARF